MPTREPLATRKNAMLTLSAFLVICTAWWYSQQPGSPPPPPPPGDTTVVVQPPDTTTPPASCTLTGGSGLVGSSTCQPCAFIPPGPGTASVDPSCVQPPDLSCKLIGGTGDAGSGTCQPCPYNPPGAGYATTATECVAPPPPQQCTLLYGTGTPGSSTCQPCPYNPPGQSFSTLAPTCVAPVPPDTTTQPTGKIGPATIAELPRVNLTYTYPTGLTQVTVPVGGNLQTAINNAVPGTEILLAPGGVWVGNFNLPNKGTSSAWILIRTNTTLTTGQMTPSGAVSKNLAQICSNNSSPAIGTSPGAHHYWISGINICGQAGSSGMNMLVRLGESGGNGQTSMSVTPHDIVMDRNYVHVLTTNNIRRCILANAYRLWFTKNWIEECHDPGGDSQAILGYNGSKEIQIEDNTLIAAHEIIMFGGADPADSTMQPSDVILRRNHIYRPAAWKCNVCPGGYLAGQWPAKNLIETKDVRRYLIEANVIENDWSDAQQFAMNFKSENQDGTAPYTTTADLTMRYNIIRNVGSGWSLSGKGSKPDPNITAARFYIHDNWLQSGWNTSPYSSTGNVTQLLGGLIDLIFAHNTIYNPSATNSVATLDGTPQVNMVWHSNVVFHGTYGFKGSGQSVGTNSINTYAPGSLIANNVLVNPGAGGVSCSAYPATTVCPTTWPTTGIAGYDGRQAGADTVKIKTMTAGVVVAP